MKLNTPNKLIIVRLVLAFIVVILMMVPFWTDGLWNIVSNDTIVINGFDLIAMVLFAVASFTDWLDGHLARKNNQVTDFGKLFDPLADKILVNSALIIFTARGYIPVLVTVIFIVRDILVDGLRMMLSSKGTVLPAHKLGKLKTVFQMIGLTLLFVVHPANLLSLGQLILIPLYVGLVFSVWSGVDYYIKGFKEINVQ